jgi:hypothetical protein
MKCFIALSKFGDIVQSLAIIHREWKLTGKKQTVITSEKFSSVFHGCSYIGKVIIYAGKWSDLHGAIKFAKTMFSDVVVLQCHGENFPFQQTKPSFQHEVYDRVGLLDEWKSCVPNFDRRDSARELSLLVGHGLTDTKYILVADQSESSQFKQIEELKLMLATKFGSEYKIVLLSQIKAHKIYDLLGIYEHAAALVTTETVHTHLAWASIVPMFVLSANGWRGSAFRKSFGFYMKYADWDRRKNDLMTALENHLSKTETMRVTAFDTAHKFGYNLSSINFQGKKIYTYRYHLGSWKTKLMICVDGKQIPLQVAPGLENHSIEDCRLFEFQGKLHGVYTVAAEIQGYWKCYQAYGEIAHLGDDWGIGHIQIKYPGNDFTGTTKNFAPFVVDGKIYFTFGIQGANQVILEMDHDRVRATHSSPAPRWEHGEIRGGVILPRGDTFLRFFHSRKDNPDKTICYFVGCAIMESKPPFKTLIVCKAPVLSGDDEFVAGCKHWKGRVVFPLGAIQRDDKILLSYGKNDCCCEVIELTEGDLNL